MTAMKNFWIRSLNVLCLLCLVAVFGCAPLKPYDGVVRAPKSSIEVFEPGHEPTKPYSVIMTFSEAGKMGDQADRERSFVEKAKKLGADAIMLKEPVIGGHKWSAMRGLAGGQTECSFSAAALVYKTER
jgi:hypothetical protein